MPMPHSLSAVAKAMADKPHTATKVHPPHLLFLPTSLASSGRPDGDAAITGQPRDPLRLCGVLLAIESADWASSN
jgi:hypothetical protein